MHSRQRSRQRHTTHVRRHAQKRAANTCNFPVGVL